MGKKKINVIVTGAAGRMGKRIITKVNQSPNLRLTAAVEEKFHQSIGADAGLVSGIGEIGVKINASLEAVIARGDVIIDFSHHSATTKFIPIAGAHHKPMVIGTTALVKEILIMLKSIANDAFPCVQAPNMSVGVNVLFKLAEKTASILGDAYDVEIVEAHHRMKKDAPSGTAVKLGEMVAAALGRDLSKVGVFERNGIIGERTNEEIGIQTIRAGDITGEHTVYFAGPGERIELIHRAHTRDNFAGGATKAAEWVIDQSNGLYTMFDVLGLNDF